MTRPDLTSLFTTHHTTLLRRIRRYTSTLADAEDILQDAFLRAMTWPGAFDESKGLAWLTTVAINLAIQHWRRRTNAPVVHSFNALEPAMVERLSFLAVPEPDEPVEIEPAVLELLEQLTDYEHKLLLAVYTRGLKRYADVQAIPAVTMRTHLHRLRARLQPLVRARSRLHWRQPVLHRRTAPEALQVPPHVAS